MLKISGLFFGVSNLSIFDLALLKLEVGSSFAEIIGSINYYKGLPPNFFKRKLGYLSVKVLAPLAKPA